MARDNRECMVCGEPGVSNPEDCPVCEEAQARHRERTGGTLTLPKKRAPGALNYEDTHDPDPKDGGIVEELKKQVDVGRYNLDTAEGRAALNDRLYKLTEEVTPKSLRNEVRECLKEWRWALLQPYRHSHNPSAVKMYGPGGKSIDEDKAEEMRAIQEDAGQRLAAIMEGKDGSMYRDGRNMVPTAYGIACAAIRLNHVGEGACITLPPPARYPQLIQHAFTMGLDTAATEAAERGFLTTRGTFVGAEAAVRIAHANGQLTALVDVLEPEDLW